MSNRNQNYGMHKNGRPARATQLQIQSELRKYFELGISAIVTASQTGINPKTVGKYFDELSKQISQSETDDFLQRQKKERERIIISLDKQIFDAIKFGDLIDEQIENTSKQGGTIPRHLIGLKLEIMKFISNLTEKKGNFVMELPMDESVKKRIGELMREHGTTRSDS